MIIHSLVVGPIETNCYIVADEKTLVGAVIDPGGDGDAILQAVDELGVDVRYVINTHAHFDHTGANGQVIAATGAKLAMNRAEAPMLAQGGGGQLFGIFDVSSPPPDIFLKDGDMVDLGETQLLVMGTPGHSAGDISLYSEAANAVFVGDCLFYSGIGRTDLPGGDYGTLMASIDRILALPDETVIYPGHGITTTVTQEKENNPFLG